MFRSVLITVLEDSARENAELILEAFAEIFRIIETHGICYFLNIHIIGICKEKDQKETPFH